MNIGILTHCIANNFGANLQALSTACYLRNQGYTPIFFCWDEYLKKRSSKMDIGQLEQHRSFLSRHGFIVSYPCCSDNDFVNVIKQYNIHNILVGSDAVFTISSWLDRIVINRNGIKIKPQDADKQFPNPFWIPFADQLDNCKFFYLSPSCQSTNYKLIGRRTLLQMKNIISKFDYLSARDSCTRDMLKYILGKNVEIPMTPDPVWGLTENITEIPSKKDIIQKYKIKNDYMLVSYYGQQCKYIKWHDEFRAIANRHGIEVYNLPMPQGHFASNLPKIELPIDALDWFTLIKYSKGYIGYNMHPVIVSIHNSVPFHSFDQHGRKFGRFLFDKTSKVYDLLDRFSMLNHRTKITKRKEISPMEVFNNLQNFDRGKSMAISKRMQEEYIAMMATICSKFIN